MDLDLVEKESREKMLSVRVTSPEQNQVLVSQYTVGGRY